MNKHNDFVMSRMVYLKELEMTHTPEEVKQILETERKVVKKIMPPLMIGFTAVMVVLWGAIFCALW